ncbi:MAG: energy transducer TonB [Bacteroidia bacterium]
MQLKKNPDKDVKNKRLDFTLIGLTVSIALVLLAFEWTNKPEKTASLGDFVIDEDLVVMENTVQEKKPPPPPPPPELEVVEDEVEIDEDQPEFEDTETDQDEEMQVFEEDEDEPINTGEIFDMFAVSDPAKFGNGEADLQKFLHENIVYPQMAIDAELEGQVVVQFVIDEKGRCTDFKILSPRKGFGLEEAAIDVLKLTSGKWKPAKQRDHAVKMRFLMPVTFSLY